LQEYCAYRDVGAAAVCFSCASQGVTLVGRAPHCTICNQLLPESGRCSNYWCRRPVEDRHFTFINAIAMRSGILQTAIDRYKYSEKRGWAAIFGRVLVGYLDVHPDLVDGWDAIIPSPTYLGSGARRTWDHIGRIIDQAAIEAGDRLPIWQGSPIVIKTAETPSLVGKRLLERREICETELRGSLEVPTGASVRDRSFLVFDDVFTDGSTLREVAGALLAGGASRVSGLVLARQPWTSAP
jgi:predicted amidophosphoribosyltransferase